MPANEHKQLIVIDFEYASANVPGLEFANHFVHFPPFPNRDANVALKLFQTEWCYNYHDAEKPYALNENVYPTPVEQRRFLSAYIQHRPFASVPPTPNPDLSSSSSSLDSRAPPEIIRDEAVEAEIQRLMHEARLWRVANSAQWVAWGIVQATVPGMDEALKALKRPVSHAAGTLPNGAVERPTLESPGGASQENEAEGDEEGEGEEEEEFDYLGYAQDRAMFFWGDVLQLGIVTREQLPATLLDKIKRVQY